MLCYHLCWKVHNLHKFGCIAAEIREAHIADELSLEMDSMNLSQIQDMAVYISLHSNVLKKGMNPVFSSLYG